MNRAEYTPIHPRVERKGQILMPNKITDTIYLALYKDGRGAGIVKTNNNRRVIDGFMQVGFVEIDEKEYRRIQRQLKRDDDKAARKHER
jgi:hypothetical protein